MSKTTISANGLSIEVKYNGLQGDYISLTDIAKYKTSENPGYVIQNWMRTRSTVRFLGLWERFHNPDFNCLEFEAIEQEAGLNSFVLTPKRWIETTNAIGMISKQGRYAATFAHQDIAFEFASWISPEFKLYIIKDYQRLISSKAQSFVYANEADVINVALFGTTAKMWRDNNPDLSGNIRDYATLQQLIVLVNLESMNAELIKLGLTQAERAVRLNKMAIEQLQTLEKHSQNKQLEF